MLALIITIAVAIMTLIVCIFAEHKEELYEDIYKNINEKSNSKK